MCCFGRKKLKIDEITEPNKSFITFATLEGYKQLIKECSALISGGFYCLITVWRRSNRVFQ